ncbi:MAG TPA: DUF3604 domain-containing protein [Candidatus Binatia bacterium]|jgi:hypothetical protein|nr:DUF3604 domain-containing protein [Candidatus Binatia bacterium]
MTMPRLAILAILLASVPSHAASVRTRADAYALVAAEAMRVQATTVRNGDLAVAAGRMAVGGGLDATGRQLVATSVRVSGTATCDGILAGDVRGTTGTCPLAGGAPSPAFPELPPTCGIPAAVPACDRARRVTVGAGDVQSLPPGIYGDVVVRGSGAVLELSGGRYVACSVRVLSGASLRTFGPLELVADTAVVTGTIAPAPGVALSANDVRVLIRGGRARIARGADVLARVCAPQGKLTVAKATLRGSAMARRITAVHATIDAPYAEELPTCAQANPLRNAYFGDLHVHTTLSFDAQAFDVRTTPEQAYAFAQGDPVQLPPLDVMGNGTQTVQIDRPLDFAAVTDHSEFLGEVELCVTPGSPTYDSFNCQEYRVGGNYGTTAFGVRVAAVPPVRAPDICGPDDQYCHAEAATVWDRIQQAAENAYDHSSDCRFTSFVGYEYTGSRSVSTLHRNVVFRNDHVPLPTTVFEQPTALGLWRELANTCIDAGVGCDVLAIPHNSNESNGKMFLVEYPGASGVDDERTQAALRSSMEPLFEVYQHKGSSECFNGLSGIVGGTDEQCNFEKRRYDDPPDCGDGVGAGGTITLGCVSRRDFVRGALLEGLKEQQRIGVNPLRLGMIASTDTHNGTPGAVAEDAWLGHRGTDDGTPDTRLGEGQFYIGGWRFSPGGLVGVWAEENSRPALFDAMRRRETFATSGPRITVRLFAGFGLAPSLCSDPAMLETAYAQGVAMGGLLGPTTTGGAPSFVVSALRDPGTVTRPGTQLQRVQIIKGWVEAGVSHQQVYDVAGNPANGASVDENTCAQTGPGDDALCTVWTDPDFAPDQHAFYYARVIENPSCRWHAYGCNALAPGDRPAACSDPNVPRTVQERAWTSPIWYEPEA